tara:strand:+ start:1253 stop:2386 length:1134 start_codon:yes stop_codon:yes gene_type:complete
MDDYNVNVLSEAKNEYSCRLVSILTPVIIEGIKSIFKEAEDLCIKNDEDDKYLMTFQNFLQRVPKWNSSMIDEETKRIIHVTNCNYLEDLVTCVHITQVKILTSVRVSQKQKKIDIDIPKLNSFIHRVYVEFARKVYKNVYLFEKDILPLQYQKNMRECEILCQESILNTIRTSIPVDKILRKYIDETVDEEVVEEVKEKHVLEDKPEEETVDTSEYTDVTERDNKDINVSKEETVATEKLDLVENKEDEDENLDGSAINSIKKDDELMAKPLLESTPSNRLSFNDNDSVLDMGTNKESLISAPKDIERLEEISRINEAKRKAEEAEDEFDEDEDDPPLKISSDDIKLDTLDVNDLTSNLELDLNPLPLLDDFEVLT